MVSNILFNSVSKEWLEEKKKYVKITTYNVYLLIVKNHLDVFFRELSEPQEEQIQTFVFKKLEEGLSQKTIKDIVVVIKMIFKYGYKNGYFKRKDFDIIYPNNNNKIKLDVLSKESQRSLIKYIDDNFNFQNLGILICLSTGIRIGELCGLKWSDVNINESTISISRTVQRTYNPNKNKKTEVIIHSPKTSNSFRDVPLSNKLLKIMKSLKKIVNDDFYILTNNIVPNEPRTYRNYFTKLLEELSIPKIKFHGLRHTFATRCIESGGDYKTISVILGHSTISTTLNLYVHPNNDQKRKCIEKMLKSVQRYS